MYILEYCMCIYNNIPYNIGGNIGGDLREPHTYTTYIYTYNMYIHALHSYYTRTHIYIQACNTPMYYTRTHTHKCIHVAFT